MGVTEEADSLSIATAFDATPISSHQALGTTNPTFPRSRVDEMPPELRTKVQSLSLTQLETLRDMTVACLLDGKEQSTSEPEPELAIAERSL